MRWASAIALIACMGCPKRVSVPKFASDPPRCAAPGEPVDLAQGVLRPSAMHREQHALETYSYTRDACFVYGAVRARSKVGTLTIEATYSLEFVPLFVKVKLTGGSERGGRPRVLESAVYDFRGTRTRMIKAKGDTDAPRPPEIQYFEFRTERPNVFLGPVRALAYPWIQRARMLNEDVDRALVFDFTEYERVKPRSLVKHPTIDLPGDAQHRKVDVWSVYGREPVFVDSTGRIVGDLAGLRMEF